MTHIDAMKQGLEALEVEDMACRYEKEATPEYIAKAITSLRQAIAEAEGQEKALQSLHAENERLGLYKDAYAEQEPVAWMDEEMTCIFFDAERPEPFDFDFWKPLYATPPQRTWVGLTEQDLDYLCNLAYTGDEEFALAVQAKLMEKNA